MRLIGIDPGLNHCGWGVAELHGHKLSHIAHGVISPPAKDRTLAARLGDVFAGLKAVIETHQPGLAAIEETFVNDNPRAALALGHARAAAMVAAATSGLSVDEISATEVKKAVTGTGRADKTQVAAMVQRLLPAAGPVSKDAADALAVAIAGLHRARSPLLMKVVS